MIIPFLCWSVLLVYGGYVRHTMAHDMTIQTFWDHWWLHTLPICAFSLYTFYCCWRPPKNMSTPSPLPTLAHFSVYPCPPTHSGTYSYYISSLHCSITFTHNVYPDRSILVPLDGAQKAYTIHGNLVIHPQQVATHYCSYLEWLHTVHSTTQERVRQFQDDFSDIDPNDLRVILAFLHTGVLPNMTEDHQSRLLALARKLGIPELIRLWSEDETDIYMLTWQDWLVQEQEKLQYSIAFVNEKHPLWSSPVDPAFLYYQEEWQRVDTTKFASIILQHRLFYAHHLQKGPHLKWTKTQTVEWSKMEGARKARYGFLRPCETKTAQHDEVEDVKQPDSQQKMFTLAGWLLSLKNNAAWKNTFASGGIDHPQYQTRDNVVLWSSHETNLSALSMRIQKALVEQGVESVEYDDSKTNAHILLCANGFARIEVRCANEAPMRSLVDYFARQSIDMDAAVYDIYHGLWVSSARGMIAWKFNCNRVHRNLCSQAIEDEHRIGHYQAQREGDAYTCMPGFIRERCPDWNRLSTQVVAYYDLSNLQERPFQLLDLLMPKLTTLDASTSTLAMSREQMDFWKQQQDYYYSCVRRRSMSNNMFSLLYQLSAVRQTTQT